jgi:hypothetical protein
MNEWIVNEGLSSMLLQKMRHICTREMQTLQHHTRGTRFQICESKVPQRGISRF